MAKILIANASRAVRERFAHALSPDGHTFVLCADGAEVLREVGRDLPDMAIASAGLPGLDAFDLFRRLEVAAGRRRMPAIAIWPDLPADGDAISLEGDEAGPSLPRPEDLRAFVRARLAASEEALSQGTILVVDDELPIQRALDKRLSMEGYRTILAMDGEEGLRALEQAPDLVLLDLAMPRRDGLSMLAMMRADLRYHDIPVIVMTAHAIGGEDAARALRIGASDYVRKPFDWEEFRARVQTQLRVRKAHCLAVEKERDLAIIELAGAAAHEINNPLAVVMARMELLMAGTDQDGPVHRELVQVEQMVRRIADVVRKMGQVRRYQVQNYCGGVNILDLDRSAADDGRAEG